MDRSPYFWNESPVLTYLRVASPPITSVPSEKDRLSRALGLDTTYCNLATSWRSCGSVTESYSDGGSLKPKADGQMARTQRGDLRFADGRVSEVRHSLLLIVDGRCHEVILRLKYDNAW